MTNIGAALISADGIVLGRGHNERIQKVIHKSFLTIAFSASLV